MAANTATLADKHTRMVANMAIFAYTYKGLAIKREYWHIRAFMQIRRYGFTGVLRYVIYW